MQKEYVVCDRCGKEIHKVFNSYPTKIVRYTTDDVQMFDSAMGYQEYINALTQPIKDEVENYIKRATFSVYCESLFKHNNADLCYDCMKRFKRFMRNEI